MIEVAYLVLGFAMLVVPFSAMVWFGLRSWRGGADRPWSDRVGGLFLAGFGALILAMLALAVTADDSVPPWVTLVIGVATFAVLALGAAEPVLRALEERHARRVDVELGRPVSRWMLHPALVAGGWVIAAVGGCLAIIYGGSALAERRIAAGTLTTRREVDAVAEVIAGIAVGWLVLAMALGTLHTVVQVYRRRREERATDRRRAATRLKEDDEAR